MGIMDNLMKNGESNLNGMLGNVSKAVLMFPDLKPEDIEKNENPCAAIGGAMGGMMGKTFAIAKNADKGLDNLKKTMEEKISLAKGQASGFSEPEINLMNKVDYKTFTVQFNPSNIRIISRGGGMRPVSDFNANGESGGIKMSGLKPYAEINISLMFDDCNNADAFMLDKFVLSPTTTVKNVASMVKASVQGEYTVRPQVEGFLGAMRNKYHRMVIFQWGNLRYWGVMNNIQGKYLMFNPSGEPVRAEVTITISSGSTEKDSLYKEFWQERYTQLVTELTTDSGGLTTLVGGTGGASFENPLNNILNI